MKKLNCLVTATLVLASSASAQAPTEHYALSILDSPEWINETKALGAPDGIICKGSPADWAKNDDGSTAYLVVTSFDPFIRPQGEVVTQVWADCLTRYDEGETGRWRLQILDSAGQVIFKADTDCVSSGPNGNCRWRFDSDGSPHGVDVTDAVLGAVGHPNDIDHLRMQVRRYNPDCAWPVDLKVKAFKYVIRTEKDCDENGIPDTFELNPWTDCNDNQELDRCEAGYQDCDNNGRWDVCDFGYTDCNGNGLWDICEPDYDDCNANGIKDKCESGYDDCNGNGKWDLCEAGYMDCDDDGTWDICQSGYQDCNGNGVWDQCDIADGNSLDCNGDGIPDECQNLVDCNNNGVPDACDIADGTSTDCDQNGVPDECDPDCDGNGLPDACESLEDCDGNGVPDICDGDFVDCNQNGRKDSCDIADGTSMDCDANGIPDECQQFIDCNGNGVHDACDIADGTSQDLDGDGIPDECEDCNGNGVPDDTEILNDPDLDCDGDGTLDECEILMDPDLDCDENGVLDSCDLAGDPDLDRNGNGVLDSCECVTTNYCETSPNSIGPGALISSTGLPSVQLNELTLTITAAAPNQFGIFFYGPEDVNVPFGDGVRCVGSGDLGVFRLLPPIKPDFFGDGSYALDLTTPPANSGPGKILAGSTWFFQYWYRDPGGPKGTGFNFSDGLSVTFCN